MKEPRSFSNNKPHVTDAVLKHGNPLDPHAKGKSCKNFTVIVDVTVHFRIDHAGTKDLKPAGILADPAPLAFADDAGNIHFCAGLSKGEEAGAQSDA